MTWRSSACRALRCSLRVVRRMASSFAGGQSRSQHAAGPDGLTFAGWSARIDGS